MVVEVENIDVIKKGDVLVDFYTQSCAPCKAMIPVLEEISKEFTNLKVAKIEVTRNPTASQMFGVMSVPTLMFMSDSRVMETSRGFQNKNSIKAMLSRNMKTGS